MDKTFKYRVEQELHDSMDYFAIGRKWGIMGKTRMDFDSGRANVVIECDHKAEFGEINKVTRLHEIGHISVANDLLSEAVDEEEAHTWSRGYDRWQVEIEAWIRGFEGAAHTIIDEPVGEFMLDCLNTYRRALEVPDDEWTMARIVLCDSLIDPTIGTRFKKLYDHIGFNYVPMEPDPNDEDPNGEGGGDPGIHEAFEEAEFGDEEWKDKDFPRDIEEDKGGQGTEKDTDKREEPDYADDDSDPDGDGEGQRGAERGNDDTKSEIRVDRTWFEPEVLEDVAANGLKWAADRYLLDENDAPIIAKALDSARGA